MMRERKREGEAEGERYSTCLYSGIFHTLLCTILYLPTFIMHLGSEICSIGGLVTLVSNTLINFKLYFFCFSRILATDEPPITLHAFMRGTHKNFIRKFCGNEDMYRRIEAAVDTLRQQAPTKRACIEEKFETPSEYAKYLTRKTYIHDHRFSSGLHVSLQVKAFGEFLDFIQGEDELDSKYYEVAASLMTEVSGSFHNEQQFQNTFLEEVEKLLPCAVQVHKGHAITDATIQMVINGQNCYLANWEFKNDLREITSDPILQNNAYFVHLQSGNNHRSPMLLLTVIGCHFLQVFGAAWNGGDVCIDPLCSPVSLLYVPRDPRAQVARTARVLAAIASTVDDLKEYYSDPGTVHQGPYLRDCNSGKLENVKEMKGRSWLFEGKLKGEEVVIKFSSSYYGEEVHRHLADLCLAPKLYMCKKLCGGWYAIVMEKIKGSRLLQLNVTKPVKEALKYAVDTMHEEDYVHGDVRPQNIVVVNDSRVCILDFDWAGKKDTVRYPVALNMSRRSVWHPDVKPGGLITKEHDLYQLEQLEVVE